MTSKGKFALICSSAIGAALLAGTPMSALAQEDATVTIVATNEPDTLDPCETGHAAIGRVAKNNIVETMLDINTEDSSLEPRLATSWEQVDEDTWRFHLVENAMFTDGTPFNAEAVVFNIERAMQPDFVCANKAFQDLQVTAEAVDEYTVEVTADRPVPILPIAFTALPMASTNTPMDQYTREPVGTGPYVLSDWDSGIEIVMERNDNYWGETPEIAEARFVFRNESAVRAAMVETGEADIALELSEQDADDPNLDHPYFNSETTWLRLDEKYPPLDDIRVRKALNHAVDKQAMLGTVITDEAVPATQLPVPSIDGHNEDIEGYAYDPELAQQLLAEAKADGVNVDAPIRFLGRTGVFVNADEVSQVLTQMFNRVGLNVSLEMMERARHAEFQSKPYPEDVGPNITLIMSDNNRADASFSVFGNFHTEGGQATTYLHPEIDQMIEEASVATGEERTKLHEELLQKIHDEAVHVPLFNMVAFTRVSDRLDWVPTIESNSQIEIQEMKLK